MHKNLLFFLEILIQSNFQSIYEFSEFSKNIDFQTPISSVVDKGWWNPFRLSEELGTIPKIPRNCSKTQRNFIIVQFISILNKFWPIYKIWKFSIFQKNDPNSYLRCWMPPPPASRSTDWGRGVPKNLDVQKIAENIFLLGKRLHRIDAVCDGLLFAAFWMQSCVRIVFDFVLAPFFAENHDFPIMFC